MNVCLIDKVKKTISDYSMLSTDSKVLCGFSGGADSTALLLALMQILPKENIIACHINHKIRGEEAERDAQFCVEKCSRLGIRIIVAEIDIPHIALSNSGSIEEIARNERYNYFYNFCKAENIDRIAVAHNKNDNVETVIFNLARGCSLKGLGGIPPTRDKIIRPLIECSREEIIDFLSASGETFVTDSTNSDTKYTRNLIRNEILPLLNKISDSAVNNISRTSDNIKKDEKCFDSLSADDSLCLRYDEILSRKVIREYRKVSLGELSCQNIKDCIILIRNNKLWSRTSLPDGIELQITRDGFEFIDTKKDHGPREFYIEAKEGVNIIPFGEISISYNTDCKINSNGGPTQKSFSADSIIGNLVIRSRRSGDTILTNGMNKSLKKLLNEKKIPLSDRQKLIIFQDEKGIIWIPGVITRDNVYNDAPYVTIELKIL